VRSTDGLVDLYDDKWLKKQGVDPHKYVPNATPEYLGNLNDFTNLDD
jgi:hypothetical protein